MLFLDISFLFLGLFSLVTFWQDPVFLDSFLGCAMSGAVVGMSLGALYNRWRQTRA